LLGQFASRVPRPHLAPAATTAGSEHSRAAALLPRSRCRRTMLAAAVLSTVGAPAAMLRGSYPDFAAPLYHASASVCDAMAAPCAAAGDGTTLDTAALQACIDHCPRAPDGSFAVVLRSGRRFLSGSLNLTSGCHLVIDGVLLGSTDPADYPVVPPLPGYGPGQRDIALHGWGRHQALLSGWNMSDVVVSGRGIIDGQGLVVDPKLKSSWVSRLRSYISCKKSKGGCAGKPSASLPDFGRPRVWEPMFSSRLALVNLTVTNQVPLSHPRPPHAPPPPHAPRPHQCASGARPSGPCTHTRATTSTLGTSMSVPRATRASPTTTASYAAFPALSCAALRGETPQRGIENVPHQVSHPSLPAEYNELSLLLSKCVVNAGPGQHLQPAGRGLLGVGRRQQCGHQVGHELVREAARARVLQSSLAGFDVHVRNIRDRQ
jgi:hypothetical protein